jgi:hypothetical protein
MRIEEMHLLNAEAKSRLGNDSDARVVLKNLLTIRNGRSLFRCYVRNYIAKEIYYKLELNFGVKGKATYERNKATTTRGSNLLLEIASNIMMLN